jgi:hypothetical protein
MLYAALSGGLDGHGPPCLPPSRAFFEVVFSDSDSDVLALSPVISMYYYSVVVLGAGTGS